jgi:hypothetical protein
MSDVFISYSHKDSAFVGTLDGALRKSNRKTWVDWEGIAKGATWWQEIEEGIEGADTFVFVISPDSVASEVCQKEINHAMKYNKQILPIVYRDADHLLEKENSAHQAISSHNWLFFRETDDFEKSFQELIKALNLDITHVKDHTRLLVRALEWDNKERNESFLLRGEDLTDAEVWLKAGVNKDPKPTDLQIIYIENSRKVEDANNQAFLILKKANEEAKEKIENANQEVAEAKIKVDHSNLQVKEANTKVETAEVRIRRGLIFFGVMVVGAVTALSIVWNQSNMAKNNLQNTEIKAFATEAKAAWIDNPTTLDSLLIALKAGHLLQTGLSQSMKVPPVTQWQTKIALQQAEKTVQERNRLSGHRDAINSVSFSPDGQTLATASWDSRVKLWDVKTGKELLTFFGHTKAVRSVSFSPDSKILATASDEFKKFKTRKGTSTSFYCTQKVG